MSVAVSRVRIGRQPAAVGTRRRFWLTQAGILLGAIVVYFGVRTLTEGSPSAAARNAGWIMDAGVVGIIVFATFPVAPPRLLDVGMVDTVTQQSHAYRVLQPPSLVNRYAAMPSFHAGWDLLMGMALVREGRTPLVERRAS